MADKPVQELKFQRTFTPITDKPEPAVDPLDALVKQRNELLLEAEAVSEEMGDRVDARLGVANRHIQRVLAKQLELTPAVEAEIQRSIITARDWLFDQKAGK